VGLEDIVSRRRGARTVGFFDDDDKAGDRLSTGEGIQVEPEDFVRYGLIPELVGRLPVVTTLADLKEADLVRILVEPRNCMVKQYQKLLAMEGITLSFTDSALRELASMAIRHGTGARGLRSIVEQIMLEVMFEAPRSGKRGSVRITKTMLLRQLRDKTALAGALKKAS